jgi:hypothetical protein
VSDGESPLGAGRWPIRFFFELAAHSDARRFAQQNPHPFLLFERDAAQDTLLPEQTHLLEEAPDARGPVDAFLVISLPLSPEGATVGRSQKCTIQVPLDTVSSRHGLFARDGDHTSFTDLCSSNGSFLNRRRLKAQRAQRLQTGDVLHLGPRAKLLFLESAALLPFIRLLKRA